MQGRASGASRNRLTTQTYLLGLVAGVVVPLLAFAAFLLGGYHTTERGRVEREAAQIARQVALVIDSDLGGMIALLKGLASSAALHEGDLSKFHQETVRLVAGRDETVILREFGQKQLVNSSRPFGSPLPPGVPITPDERAAYDAGEPHVSGVFSPPRANEVRIVVAVPVTLASGRYLLGITVPTTRIRDAVLRATPPGWLIGVGDRADLYVTRSARHEEITGKPALAAYTSLAVGRSGTFVAEGLDGPPLLAGYYRSELTGWLIAANILVATVEAPLWRALFALSAIGVIAFGLSLLLAYLFGKRLTAATSGLARRAHALGEGQAVAPMDSRIAEFAFVGDALVEAAEAIEARARERRLLVNELNHRVKNTLATVQSIAFQTLRGTTSLEDARSALTNRLVALAKTHDVLTRENWEGAELHEIVADATKAHGGNERIVLEGPPVWLEPSLSLSLALILHELGTNAAKYGALSVSEGSVAVSWTVTPRASDKLLTLRWVERNGPPVQPPSRQGFGSRLIQGGLSSGRGASTKVDYEPTGLVCALEIPIDGEHAQQTAAEQSTAQPS